ncbi:fimbrial protein [Providencia vermicola]|uniref:fimbrial protein n=1 Tax=Providencia vermicola TaxID=333965 RepID=UPI0032DA7F2C
MKIMPNLPFLFAINRVANGMLLVVLCFCSSIAFAETYTLKVKITVVEKTCDIYGNGGINQPITVNLGDITIKKIDGVQYETDIPYTIDCEDSAQNPKLKLKFDGASSPFNANLLKTQDPNLGLRFKAGNTLLNLGAWEYFNYATRPTLSVVPVTSQTGGVKDGELDASATLSVEYQ